MQGNPNYEIAQPFFLLPATTNSLSIDQIKVINHQIVEMRVPYLNPISEFLHQGLDLDRIRVSKGIEIIVVSIGLFHDRIEGL